MQYYKALLSLLGPHMVKTFNTLGQFSSFPPATPLAHILFISKEGKVPSSCNSYWPISLLNVVLKLFTKLLASRLQSHLPQLVHLDKVGFIPMQEARDTISPQFSQSQWDPLCFPGHRC